MAVPMLLSLPAEVLLEITDYLPAYDKLCLRISCKRFYSLLSDPRAWSSLVWKNCRSRDQDFKALRLALGLSHSYVQHLHLSYMAESHWFTNATCFRQIAKCKQIRYLSLIGRFFKSVKQNSLERLLSQLPSLYCLSVTRNEVCAIKAAKASKSLKVLCIYPEVEADEDGDVELGVDVVDIWKGCGYMPPNLKIHCYHCFTLPSLTSSDHPAQLSIYPNSSPIAGNVVNKYPIFRFSFYPNVVLLTCPSKSVCSSASHSSNLIVSRGNSSNKDPVSAIQCNGNLNARTITMPFFPSSIESLRLSGTEKLSPADLTLVSELCPKLICLDIRGCTNALSSLLGLADISSNCAGLAALNIAEIDNIENVSSLWEVLSRMRKLRYLSMSYSCVAIQHCVSFAGISLAQMNLLAIHIIYDGGDYDYILQVERLLPAFRMLQHLHIDMGSATLNLTNVLPNLPSLTQLFIDSSVYGLVTLPTDPDCYSSLNKLYISCQEFDVFDDLARALSQSPSLTYLYLDVRRSSPLLIELLGSFRQLCECYIYDRNMDTTNLNVQGQLEQHGICGYVYPNSSCNYQYLQRPEFIYT